MQGDCPANYYLSRSFERGTKVQSEWDRSLGIGARIGVGATLWKVFFLEVS